MGSEYLIALAAATLQAGGRPESVLEIGCGDGERTLFLAREYPRARVRGVDADEGAVRAAAARIGLDPEGRVAFRHARGRRIPFPDDHFDLVVRSDGAPDAETTRVLRAGGRLIQLYGPRRRPRPAFAGRLAERRLARRGLEPLGRGGAGGAGGATYLVAELKR